MKTIANPSVFKVLLRQGAKDVGNKCLHHVIATKDEEITTLLLGKGMVFLFCFCNCLSRSKKSVQDPILNLFRYFEDYRYSDLHICFSNNVQDPPPKKPRPAPPPASGGAGPPPPPRKSIPVVAYKPPNKFSHFIRCEPK